MIELTPQCLLFFFRQETQLSISETEKNLVLQFLWPQTSSNFKLCRNTNEERIDITTDRSSDVTGENLKKNKVLHGNKLSTQSRIRTIEEMSSLNSQGLKFLLVVILNIFAIFNFD